MTKAIARKLNLFFFRYSHRTWVLLGLEFNLCFVTEFFFASCQMTTSLLLLSVLLDPIRCLMFFNWLLAYGFRTNTGTAVISGKKFLLMSYVTVKKHRTSNWLPTFSICPKVTFSKDKISLPLLGFCCCYLKHCCCCLEALRVLFFVPIGFNYPGISRDIIWKKRPHEAFTAWKKEAKAPPREKNST